VKQKVISFSSAIFWRNPVSVIVFEA